MSEEDIASLAEAWHGYWAAEKNDPIRNTYAWSSMRVFDLLWEDEDPESLWKMILAVHRRDQSIKIQQVLSAGPLEDLLAKYGGKFIERVEEEARLDPGFARLMGGVWKNSINDDIWQRVQAAWDRRGWDGIPE